MRRIAVIGAGIAGIAAAQLLTQRHCSVTVFEKSKGFGGRCATRRWEGHAVDHGVQYVTAREERFIQALFLACKGKLLQMKAPVSDETGEILPDLGRWFHRDGNSHLVRDLANGLDVRLETLIADARPLLATNGGEFDEVISTAPIPQTAALFGLTIPADYAPCLTALFCYRGEWLGRSQQFYAIRSLNGPLAWSCCENHKLGRVQPGYTVFVAQMAESPSRCHLEVAPEQYPDLMRDAVEARWQLPSDAYHSAVGIRWRYARVKAAVDRLELPPHCHYAGDGLAGSRLEDAWLAGLRVADKLSRA